MNFFWFPLEFLPFIIVIMLLAFAVHEFAHAWTAWKFGDDTAYMQGRVTLNPIAHLDWLGMLMLLIVGFGWAKPVPVRRGRFKRPRLMSVIVSAAGPLSNLLLAFLLMLFVDVLHAFDLFAHISADALNKINMFIYLWVQINLALFIFNLIPLPPLDGYRILEEFLPIRARLWVQQYAQWTTFVFLLLVFVPLLRDWTIGPLFAIREPLIDGMVAILQAVFDHFGGSFIAYLHYFWG